MRSLLSLMMIAAVAVGCGDDTSSTFAFDGGDAAPDQTTQSSDACVICGFDAGKDAPVSDASLD